MMSLFEIQQSIGHFYLLFSVSFLINFIVLTKVNLEKKLLDTSQHDEILHPDNVFVSVCIGRYVDA